MIRVRPPSNTHSRMPTKDSNCPQCGAGLEPGRSRCSFCGTTFRATAESGTLVASGVSCPACGETSPWGQAHCSGCGVPLLSRCPIAACGRKVTVWQRHCGHCGAEIASAVSAALREEADRLRGEATRYREDVESARSRRDSALRRQRWTRILIAGAGILLSSGCLSTPAWWLGGLGIAVALLVARGYGSPEIGNLGTLEAAARAHLARIEGRLGEIDRLLRG